MVGLEVKPLLKMPIAAVSRRAFLASTAVGLLLRTSGTAFGLTVSGSAPFATFAYSPPETLGPAGWYFFTPDEAKTVEAIAEQLIPADELSVSGKDAGCVVFIDRQLAGSFGSAAKLYMRPPFQSGTAFQGDQLALVPRDRYRLGLVALDVYCREAHNQPFAALPSEERDTVLSGLETGRIKLRDFDGQMLFTTILSNTMEGFFADPIYGGNRDMVSWKMIGFPGARYDYRDYIERHNEKLDLQPLSIMGRPAWKAKG